jgi:N-acetylmuramoyl-L-alanine amidase
VSYVGRVNKKDAENFASEKQQKMRKRTRFSPKKAKPGAFWVLEGMGTVENG